MKFILFGVYGYNLSWCRLNEIIDLMYVLEEESKQ